jgi:hypothetical protein
MGKFSIETKINVIVIVVLGGLTIPYAWFFGLNIPQYFVTWVFVSIIYLLGTKVYPLFPEAKK